jgi:transposase, IS5 family
MEDAVYDSQAVRRFIGVDLNVDTAPDATTLLKFRRLLETHSLTKVVFDTINGHLAAKGLLLKEGTILDATIIAAPSSTKNQAGERDPDMHQAKKGNEWHFGMKPGKRRALPDTPLGQLLEKIEHARASIRAKVEHPFHVVKNLFRHRKTRYRGLSKNTAQLLTLFGMANLVLARKCLIAIHAQGASRVGKTANQAVKSLLLDEKRPSTEHNFALNTALIERSFNTSNTSAAP